MDFLRVVKVTNPDFRDIKIPMTPKEVIQYGIFLK